MGKRKRSKRSESRKKTGAAARHPTGAMQGFTAHYYLKRVKRVRKPRRVPKGKD